MKLNPEDYVTISALPAGPSGFTISLKADSGAARAAMAMCAMVPSPVEVATSNGLVIKAQATSIVERINGVVDVCCDFSGPDK